MEAGLSYEEFLSMSPEELVEEVPLTRKWIRSAYNKDDKHDRDRLIDFFMRLYEETSYIDVMKKLEQVVRVASQIMNTTTEDNPRH